MVEQVLRLFDEPAIVCNYEDVARQIDIALNADIITQVLKEAILEDDILVEIWQLRSALKSSNLAHLRRRLLT